MPKQKLVVVVGPTASGKTSLAINLAKQFGGEVISADSRQVYRGLDIGTAKVTKEEMGGISHHLIDVAEVSDVYTATDFKRDATSCINQITDRGNLPIIAGGTFFYIDTLLGKIDLPQVAPNPPLRAQLEQVETAELFAMLETKDPQRAENIDQHNRRRLIRALEIADALGTVPLPSVEDLPYDTLTIGIMIDPNTHEEKIRVRLIERLEAGMITEVEGLLTRGVTHERLQELGLEYRYVSLYLLGEYTYDEMIGVLSKKIWQYAKRQMTWLKRDPNVNWVSPADKSEVELLMTAFLVQ